MYNLSSYFDSRENDPCAKMHRELFIYRLINYFNGNSVIPDGANADYEQQSLSLASKRRLHNELLRKAEHLATEYNRTHKRQVSKNDYQVLIHAFFETNFGKNFKDTYASDWCNRSLSNNVSNEIAVEFIDSIESWTSSAGVVAISPYDNMFVKSDAFDDEHDAIAYSVPDANGDLSKFTFTKTTLPSGNGGFSSTMLALPTASFADKIKSVQDGKNVDGLLVRDSADILVKSGYKDIEHYIKTRDNRNAVRQFLCDNFGKYSDEEIEFMIETCKYLTSIGYDFDLSINSFGSSRELVLITDTKAEVRLIDLTDGLAYCGRIYDNGRVIRINSPTINSNGRGPSVNYVDFITNQDRLNVIKYYFGGEYVPISERDGDNKEVPLKARKLGSSNRHVGQLGIVSGVPGLTRRTGANKKQLNAYSLAKGYTTSKTKKTPNQSVLTLSYIEPNSSHDGIALSMYIGAYSSTEYSSSEANFANSFRRFTTGSIPCNPDDKYPHTRWDEFVSVTPIEQFLKSDVESYVDENGETKLRVKDIIDSSHVDYYNKLDVRNVLNSWVESAKSAHADFVDLNGLYEEYNQCLIDGTVKSHTIQPSVDENVDELRTLYWRILTGSASKEDILQYTETDSEVDDDRDIDVSMDIGDAFNANSSYLSDAEIETLLSSDTSVDVKLTVIKKHYANYVAAEFGSVPDVQKPGEPHIDNTGKGFNPQKVARYCATSKSNGIQKNYDFIRHMLYRLGDEYSPEWISSNNYISTQIKNDLVKFDDNDLIKFDVDGILSQSEFKFLDFGLDPSNPVESKKALAFKAVSPVRYQMLKHTVDMLQHSACDPLSISVKIDSKGVIHYEAKQTNKNYAENTASFKNNADSVTPIVGEIGQIFEPDKYSVIEPQYVATVGGSTPKVFVPGYNVHVLENDFENPTPLSDRLLLLDWKNRMMKAITREIHNCCYTHSSEYGFLPHGASLNYVYRKSYDMTIDKDFYEAKKPKDERHITPEEQTFLNCLDAMSRRCRFSNEFDKGATTEAQSMLEHPNSDLAKRYDYTYSDLVDNHNLRVMDEALDGVFDPDATGTARTQGIVRYVVGDVDSKTGRVIKAPLGPKGEPPRINLMKDDLFKEMYHNGWDRIQMAMSQVMTALHTPRDITIMMTNCEGLTFDDGFVVSKSFADRYPIKGADGQMRPLEMQDKLSDTAGNKGVISLVADPAYVLEDIDKHLSANYDFDNYSVGDKLQCEYNGKTYTYVVEDGDDSVHTKFAKFIQEIEGFAGYDDLLKLYRDNPDLDLVASPYSLMSRKNGATIVNMMKHPVDINLNGQVIKGGAGKTDLIVVDMPADVKTHFYDDSALKEGKGRKSSAQLAWALLSKHCYAIMEEFYGDNIKALDNLREYAIAIGLDIKADGTPVVGYHPQVERGEQRRLLKLPEVTDSSDMYSYTTDTKKRVKCSLSDRYNASLNDDILARLNKSGGFMELPFQLNFNLLDNVTLPDNVRKFDIPSDMFKLQPTGQTYVDAYGRKHPTYGMPVLSSSLRSGQEMMDGTAKTHDYTRAYIKIYQEAMIYTAATAELKRLDGALASAGTADEKAKYTAQKSALESRMKECQSNAQSAFDSVVENIVENKFETKYNLIREGIMAKRLPHSATAVWSADPRLKSDEVSMSEDSAYKLGLLEVDGKDENGKDIIKRDENGRAILKKDARVLIWRDPVLHDGNVRFMKVKIDFRNPRGICVNPLMDASFDGDFDGDSIGITVLQSQKAITQAAAKFSFKTNLLNYGCKKTITNPKTGATMEGFGLYVQSGLDRAAHEVEYNSDGSVKMDKNNKAVASSLKKRLDQLEWDANELERLAREWEQSTDSDRDKMISCEINRRGKTSTVYGQQAISALRQRIKDKFDALSGPLLKGIGDNIIVVENPETVIASLQKIVDNGAKGNMSKMIDGAHAIGLDFDLDADGRADLDSIKTYTDKYGNLVSQDVYFGIQRDVSLKIQETTAYKADNTQLGGVAAQKAVAAFRDLNMTAALELTYPVTQAILQSKHDPKDAKIKDEIVRFWGASCWDGDKLTGIWNKDEWKQSVMDKAIAEGWSTEQIETATSDDAFVTYLQKQPHECVTTPVVDSDGNPVYKRLYNRDTKQYELVLDTSGNPIPVTTKVKCTKEEWITQMQGMFTALKVDINSDYIDALADLMLNQKPIVKEYPVNESTKEIISISDPNHIIGVTDFVKQNGATMDKMGYFGKTGAFVSAALKNSNEYVEALTKKNLSCLLTQDGEINKTALFGDMLAFAIESKKVSDTFEKVRVDECNMTTQLKEDSSYSESDLKQYEKKSSDRIKIAAKKRDVDSAILQAHRSNSSLFAPNKFVNELGCDVDRPAGSIINYEEVVRGGKVITISRNARPLGRIDCRISDSDDFTIDGIMGECQADYESRRKASSMIHNEDDYPDAREEAGVSHCVKTAEESLMANPFAS